VRRRPHDGPRPAEASVTVDGHGSASWQVTGDESIRLDLDIGDHQIRVALPDGGSRKGRSSPHGGR
jgi:hypothetical protein